MKRALALLFAVTAVLVCSGMARAGDVTGKWKFTLETPSGDRQMEAEFKQDGDSVSGTWGATKINAKIADGKFEFSFPFTPEETGQEGTLKIKLQVDSDESISGTWEFDEYNGPLKGARES